MKTEKELRQIFQEFADCSVDSETSNDNDEIIYVKAMTEDRFVEAVNLIAFQKVAIIGGNAEKLLKMLQLIEGNTEITVVAAPSEEIADEVMKEVTQSSSIPHYLSGMAERVYEITRLPDLPEPTLDIERIPPKADRSPQKQDKFRERFHSKHQFKGGRR